LLLDNSDVDTSCWEVRQQAERLERESRTAGSGEG
jgi:hypothetical protein